MPRTSGTVEAELAAVPLSTDFCADDADVIIRAAGTLDFHVHKLILSFASPVFRDMFTLPQPPTDTPGTLPRVDISESPETWENILRTIYPMQRPIIDDLDGLGSLLIAAKKYEMQFILDSHKGIFKDREFIQRDPLRLYAIACICGFEDQAKYVARNAQHLAVTRRSSIANLEGLTMASYHRLVSFLAERDHRWNEALDDTSLAFDRSRRCNCGADMIGAFGNKIKENLKSPSLREEEFYLSALEERARLRKQGCGMTIGCLVENPRIKQFIERMAEKREKLCVELMGDTQYVQWPGPILPPTSFPQVY